MKKYRIELSNNSDARKVGGTTFLGCNVESVKHNGGKTVIVIVTERDAAALEAAMDASYGVRSYSEVAS